MYLKSTAVKNRFSFVTQPSLAHVLINFVLFQAAWFACVLGATRDLAWLGLLAVAMVCAVHLKLSGRRIEEARLLCAALLIGAVWESVLVAADFLEYPHGTLVSGLAPPWIVAMWPLFATALNVSMRWLKNGTPQGRWLVAALMGSVAGPMSFIGGQALGAVVFADAAKSTLVLAIGWAVLMPLMVWLANRYDGVVSRPEILK